MQIERETVIAAPVERGAMVLRWVEHGTTHARVVDVEPHRRFSYRWAAQAESEQLEGNSTLVEFTLDETGDGTRLRVVESGFEELGERDGQLRKRVEDNSEGWEIQLGRVREEAERIAA